MKKLFILVVASFLLLSCSNDQASNDTRDNVSNYKTAGVTVVTIQEPGDFSAGWFGCWGRNFCCKQVAVPTNDLKLIDNTTMRITYDKNNFSSKNLEYYNTNNYHIIDRIETLPESVTKQLKINPNSYVVPGEYLILKNDKKYMVVDYQISSKLITK